MDFSYTAEQQAFRERLVTWLDEQRSAGHLGSREPRSLDDMVEQGKRWQKRLYEGGWCGLHWPAEYGGQGAGLIEQIIFQEELARAGSPQLINLLALSMVGPLIIDHGTDAQKRKYLKGILTADEIWCQGYSEPGAGSDLAAVQTSAVLDGDQFVVNGQKVWTSYAQYADYCILLVRSDQSAAKHKGLTLMAVDMRSPGIETRPLMQMNGDAEFNEVFFEDVRVPRDAVIGQLGEGWRMAVALLMYERATLTFQRQLQSKVAFSDLLEQARTERPDGTRPADDPTYRRELARLQVESDALRLTSLRHLTKQLRGEPPGPEGSMEKLFWSEMFQRMMQTAMSMTGSFSILAPGDPLAPMDGRWPHTYLYSRGRTIAAGSSEIQRSIIAERVLGLPKGR